MCIRDSVEDDRVGRDLLGDGLEQDRELLVARALGESFCSCLLYTSDAADERSSVDLGGRRIIKKKTTHNNMLRELRQLQHTRRQG